MDCSPPGSSVHGDSPGKSSGVGCHALLQGIFPTQGSNPGLLHCRQILYFLSHQGSPRILAWVACPFSILPMSPPLLIYRHHIPCGTFVKAAWWASFSPVSVAASDCRASLGDHQKIFVTGLGCMALLPCQLLSFLSTSLLSSILCSSAGLTFLEPKYNHVILAFNNLHEYDK